MHVDKLPAHLLFFMLHVFMAREGNCLVLCDLCGDCTCCVRGHLDLLPFVQVLHVLSSDVTSFMRKQPPTPILADLAHIIF